MITQPFDELSLGQRRRSGGRTMTETDVVNFCGLTGNWLAIHADAEFSKRSLYGQRVVQGGLVFVVVNALLGFDSSVVEAFYGVDKLRFLKPTFIGDTLHAESEIINLRDKGERHGIATTKLVAVNQRDETVLSCEFSLLVRRQRLPAQ
ncbi:MaoC/PaaZ C-terminal domain-containing protein [Pigmentiphaga sp. GD03639]|uniref:MaoC/PaaZ C-terminal domain-containing protein n=1 Tax=Pigmentiphaga daeguensis TaxID=414049 RepID=A0ABP3LE83_9BURK|nr:MULTISPECIES: MaoC/PaaZ C-terminal domain-containing protein [unclassified Pigmentiphaga]MDH2237872.1 MaoC/PaaZ C-terminal domain-containing protein [Pigmentiphaga sp. GD03639]OVZ65130.1 dehydratase [Pigmentiphaga sp. NML030171]